MNTTRQQIYYIDYLYDCTKPGFVTDFYSQFSTINLRRYLIKQFGYRRIVSGKVTHYDLSLIANKLSNCINLTLWKQLAYEENLNESRIIFIAECCLNSFRNRFAARYEKS